MGSIIKSLQAGCIALNTFPEFSPERDGEP